LDLLTCPFFGQFSVVSSFFGTKISPYLILFK
jgi:hypothetical protein